jgi:hypothetical protein
MIIAAAAILGVLVAFVCIHVVSRRRAYRRGWNDALQSQAQIAKLAADIATSYAVDLESATRMLAASGRLRAR